ncbi:MAG: HD domain-containing protein [Oscillospiraceae bacterium]|jgi:putative hydrolase of HD superfamily|nr:HD domain-containing protein [Oscillospiraceae bacterium]
MDELLGIVRTVEDIDRLKCVTRTAWTATGRRESTAEHSFRLALFAMLLLERYEELDPLKMISLCLVHDLGEGYGGDISAALLPDPELKARAEAQGLSRLLRRLPIKTRERIKSLAEEYNSGETKEAEVVKALDKLETLISHGQGKNPPGLIDYAFNLSYGEELCNKDNTLKALRELVCEPIRRLAEESVNNADSIKENDE